MVTLWLLLALSLPVLFVACVTPIYTDEIVWKIMQARYFLDGGLVSNGFPQCGPSFLLPPPLTHLPARVIDAWLYQDLTHPLKLRAIGVLGTCLLLALAYRTLGAITPAPRSSTRLALIAMFWGLGLMPLLTVLNRPELPLLLGLWSLVLGAIAIDTGNPPWLLRRESTRSVVFLSVVLVLLGTHPKATFFLPVYLAAGWHWVRARSARATILVVVLIATVQTVDFGARRYDCPGDAWTAEKLREVSLQLGDLRSAPRTFLAQARDNVLRAPRYFGHLVFAGTYMAGWLPDHPRIPLVDDVGDALIYGVITTVYVGVLAVLTIAVRHWRRAPRLPVAVALALTFVPALVALLVYQSHKNAYDGAFLFVLSCLVLILAWPPDAARRLQRPLHGLFLLIATTTLTSEGRLLWHFGPWATHEWLTGGNLPGAIEGTISGFHYDRVNAEVLHMAHECSISVGPQSKFVLVDDLTYPALAGTTFPLHTMGVSWWGAGIPDQYDFLSDFGSGGMVVRCRSVTADTQLRARREGELCCLPPFGAR